MLEEEVLDILKVSHDESCGGHFTNKRTKYMFLNLSYYWSSLFCDAKEYVHSYDNYHQMIHLVQTNELVEPFEKWALDFVGPITPTSKKKREFVTNHET